MKNGIYVYLVTVSASAMAMMTTSLTTPAFAAKQRIQPHGIASAATAAKSHAVTPSTPPKPVAENINVSFHRYRSATGVTGTQVGGGLMAKQTSTVSQSTVTRDYIASQSPAASAYELLKLTPGTTVSMSDPYNIQGGNMSIRGLNGDEIGYLLEGAPLNNVGTYVTIPSQYPDGESLESEAIQQGSVDLTAPLIGSAGGLVQMKMRDPENKMGGQFNATFGSYNTYRQGLRLDSGYLGNSGVKFFVSYSHIMGDNWRGPEAPFRRDHIDFKLQKDWGNIGKSSLVVAYTDYHLYMLTTPTLSQYQQMGANYNYASSFTGSDKTSYYKLNGEDAGTIIVSAPTELHLTKHLDVSITPYLYHSWGEFAHVGVMPASGAYYGNQPTSLNMNGLTPNMGTSTVVNVPTNFDIEHPGINLVAGYRTGINTVKVGYWFDYTRQTYIATAGGLTSSGAPISFMGSASSDVLLPNGQPYKSTDWLATTYTHGVFIGDTIDALHHRLLVDAGLKATWVHRSGENYLPGPQSDIGLNTFQLTPRFGLRYQFTPKHQIYVSGNTAFRVPTTNSLFDTYNTAGTRLIEGNNTQKNEYSISEEIGYRYTGSFIMGSVSFFNYNFINRQIATEVPTGGGGYIQTFINAGGQTGRGVDLEFGTRPWHHWRPYASAEYLHATTDSNLRYGDTYLHTAGKTAVRSPTWSAALGLSYDDKAFFGNVTMKYMDKQYSTFMNDQSMPAHTNVDLAVGYRINSNEILKKPEFRLNIQNLAGSTYLSGIASVTGTAASNPAYYVGAGRAFIGTFSTGF